MSTADDTGAFPGLAGRKPATAASTTTPTDTPAASAAPLWVIAVSVIMLLIFSRSWITALVGPSVDAEASTLTRTLFFPAYGLALLLLVTDPRRGLNAAIAGVLPLALVLAAFASTTWSIAPDLTARRALALLFTTLGSVALAARLSWRDMARVLAATFGLLAVGSTVAAVALPHFGRMTELFPGAWRGLWQDKNALGDYMALGVCAAAGAAVLDRRLRGLWIGTAVLCLALIVLSTSKTSLVSLAAGAGAFCVVALARRSPAVAAATVLGVAAAILAAGLVVFLHPHLIFNLLGRDATLTGRTVIWEAVLRRIAERPVTGFGYAVVWNDASGWGPLAWIAKEAQFTPHHAHNSWLEAELELGYAGVALLAAFAVQTGVRLLRAGEGAWLAAPILAAFFVATLTETVTLNYNDFLWVIVPALAIRLGLRDAASGAASKPSAVPQPERPWSA
ncbi:O-antigen ligase [soil metagenome]